MPSYRSFSLLQKTLFDFRKDFISPVNYPERLEAAISWVLEAYANSADGGIPAYYDLLRGKWRPSYPETTGYLIVTLLACAEQLTRPDLRGVALKLANYLADLYQFQGKIPHWNAGLGKEAVGIVFDTGQVISGWLAAWRATADPPYLRLAVENGEWLVSVQDPSGAWSNHQFHGTVKTIDARVAWILADLGMAAGREDFLQAARKNLDWVIAQQQSNGWFQNAAFLYHQDPFTHTIAYTIEGLLESGLLLGCDRYILGAQKAAGALLAKVNAKGSLAGTYDKDWHPTASYSCLAGNCQMAWIWLHFYELDGGPRYLEAARKAIRYVASIQDCATSNRNIRGAVPGSYPIFGAYERLKYPNWAAKFYIDVLLYMKKLGEF